MSVLGGGVSPFAGRPRQRGGSRISVSTRCSVSQKTAIRPREGRIIWALTMAPRERIEKVTVLEVYRLRWQIEFLFKRLKSLLASGNSLLVRNL